MEVSSTSNEERAAQMLLESQNMYSSRTEEFPFWKNQTVFY